MKSAKTATAAVEAFYSPKNLDWSDGEARDHTIKQEVAVRLAALHGIAAIGSSEGFDVLGGTYREESIAVGNLMRCLREYGNGTGEGARPSKAMKSPHGLDRSEVAKVAATEQGRKTDLQYVPWMKHVVRAAILQDGKSFRDVGLAYRGEMPEPLCPLKGGSSGSGGGGGAATKQGGLRCKWGILCVCVCLCLNMKRWLWLWLLCLLAQCLPPCACRVALYVRVSFVLPCFAPHPQLHPVSLPLFSPLSPSRLHTHTHTHIIIIISWRSSTGRRCKGANPTRGQDERGGGTDALHHFRRWRRNAQRNAMHAGADGGEPRRTFYYYF